MIRAIEDMKQYYIHLLDRKLKFEKEIASCINDINSYRRICFKNEKRFPSPKHYKDFDSYKNELKQSRELFSSHETLFLKTNLLIDNFKDLDETIKQYSVRCWQSKEITKKSHYIVSLYQEIVELSKKYELKYSERFSVKGVPLKNFYDDLWKSVKVPKPTMLSIYGPLKRKLNDSMNDVSEKKRILENSFVE